MRNSRFPWPIFVLVAVVLSLFWPVTKAEFVRWDDDVNVYQNPYYNPVSVANVLHFWTDSYNGTRRPVVHTLWGGIAALAQLPAPRPMLGENPVLLDAAPFHWANVLLHALNAALVFVLLRALLNKCAEPDATWPAFAGALLFAVHPLQVESVAWITGVNDVLMTSFVLFCLGCYLGYARAKLASSDSTRGDLSWRGRLLYGASFAFFLLALGCKPSAVTVPLLAWALDRWMLGRTARAVTRSLWPWLVVAVPFVLISQGEAPTSLIASSFVSVGLRPFIAGDALAFYGWKLLVPLGLVTDYSRSPRAVLEAGWVYWTWLAPAALAVWFWFRGRKHPTLCAVAVFVLGALLPVLGLVPFRFQAISTVADRYMYLPLVGVALGASLLCQRGLGRAPKLTFVVASLVVLLLSGLTALQISVWQDNLTLWGYTVQTNPRSREAHIAIGVALAHEGALNEALPYLKEGIRLAPERTSSYNVLGITLKKLGRLPEALQAFQQASRLDPGNSGFRYNIALTLTDLGRLDEALAVYREALRLDPGNAVIQQNYANTLARVERPNPTPIEPTPARTPNR